VSQPKKDDLSIQFKALGIPLIGGDSPEELVEGVEQVMLGWDVVGKQRAEKELEAEKVVIAKLVKDWVNPYAMEGREIPVVLFSTHPEWKAGARLDGGLVETLTLPRFGENYLIIVFDEEHRLRRFNYKKFRWDLK